MLSAVTFGRLADTIGRKPLLVGGLAVLAIGDVLTGAFVGFGHHGFGRIAFSAPFVTRERTKLFWLFIHLFFI